MRSNHIAKGLFCWGEVAGKVGTNGAGCAVLGKLAQGEPPTGNAVGMVLAMFTGNGLVLIDGEGELNREFKALA